MCLENYVWIYVDLKWLRPSVSLVISLISLGLWQKEFGEGRMKLSIFSLKTETLLEFLKLGSKLFHSIIADGKNEFLKNLYFFLTLWILPTCSIWCTSYKNEIKKVFWMLIFENLIKGTKFSVATTKLKGL